MGAASDGRSGKMLVKRVAAQGKEQGWKAPANFNITRAYGNVIWMLYQELAAWSDRSRNGPTRGQRRIARKITHALAKGLKDMKQEPSRVDAVASGETVLLLPSGHHEIPKIVCDSDALAYKIGAIRFLIAIGSEGLSTQKRAVLTIRAFDRIGARFSELGIVPPIGRVRARASRPRDAPASDVRGEDVLEVFDFERLSEEERESTSEARTEGSAARTSGPDASARGEGHSDGWD